MTGMFAAMMPRALNLAITGFAWLATPLWAAAIAGDLLWPDDNSVALLTGAAVSSTCCALRVWHEAKVEARMKLGFAVHEHNQALVAAAFELAAGKPLAVVPSQPDGEAPSLRVVQ